MILFLLIIVFMLGRFIFIGYLCRMNALYVTSYKKNAYPIMRRHTYNIIIGLLLSFAAFMIFAACSSSPDAKDYKIAVSQPSSDSWRETMNDEIRREQIFHNGVSVEILSAENNSEKQKADLRHFIDEGVDLILVSPNDPEPLVPLIREAKAKGIATISFDRRLVGDDYTMHIEVDNEALGHEVADYAHSLFPHGARILEIQGSMYTSPAAGRHKGFTDGIARHPEMQVVASVSAHWELDEARHVADSIFDTRRDIDLVYAHSDAMAISAAESARDHGLAGIKYLGIDGILDVGVKAVSDSILTATFLYPTYGYLLLRQAIDVLDGKPYERELILPPVSAVDLRNADILRQQVEMQYEETDKIIKLRDKLNSFLSQYATQQMLLLAAVVIVVFGFVIVIVLYRTNRQDKRHRRALTEKNEQLELEKRKQEALYEQLADATQAKLMFFTNVSHDLRTPLTLIAEPVAQMCEADNLTDEQSQLMAIAHKNVSILRRLIDQILDFRKYENGKNDLNLFETNIYPLLQDWAGAFEVIARKRGMDYTVSIPALPDFSIAIDAEKAERVVFNLISNAFKYTPDGGAIEVESHHTDEAIIFTVTDNGRGIAHEEQERIFDRFYQVEKGTPNSSGIGLALCKAFVEMQSGSLTVESELGRGSRFTVSIPISHVAQEEQDASRPVSTTVEGITKEAVLAELEAPPTPPDSLPDDQPVLLVIDDNFDILRLISVLLTGEYRVLTATDGQKGLQMAMKYVPDVILCDVMMPVMDGLECCRILKHGIATCHIPILMLTACSLDEQRIEGYESGADGYMPKPFNAEVLRARLKNLLENRKRLEVTTQPQPPLISRAGGMGTAAHESSSPEVVTAPSRSGGPKGVASLPVGEMDKNFYMRVLDILNEEYNNANLSIEQIATRVGLSQSQFSRKVKALTNYTPVELIRRIRVEMGHKLLSDPKKTISEVAYEVGFSDPNYFSKCHKQIYGETPSELRTKLKLTSDFSS